MHPLEGVQSVEGDTLRLGETAEVYFGLGFCVLGNIRESVLLTVDVDKYTIPCAHIVCGRLGNFHFSFRWRSERRGG